MAALGGIGEAKQSQPASPPAPTRPKPMQEAGGRLVVSGEMVVVTSTEITRDTSGFAGGELPNAPRHKVELWMRYRFPQNMGALMIAGGVVHVSDRFTARDNVVIRHQSLHEHIDVRLGVIDDEDSGLRQVFHGSPSRLCAGRPLIGPVARQ